MGAGTLIQYRLRLHGVPVGWKTLIQDWEPPRRFVDAQLRGPYALWHHTHELRAASTASARCMPDTVRYAIGFGPLGALAHRVARAPRPRGDLRLPRASACRALLS